jgi:hypothetical protein
MQRCIAVAREKYPSEIHALLVGVVRTSTRNSRYICCVVVDVVEYVSVREGGVIIATLANSQLVLGGGTQRENGPV